MAGPNPHDVTNLYGVKDFRLSVGLSTSGDVIAGLCLVRRFWDVEDTVLELNSTSRQQITCNWNITAPSRSGHLFQNFTLFHPLTFHAVRYHNWRA